MAGSLYIAKMSALLDDAESVMMACSWLNRNLQSVCLNEYSMPHRSTSAVTAGGATAHIKTI